MRISSINSKAFFAEVAESQTVWSIRDENGIPAPKNSDGLRSMPFWSSERRALNCISQIPDYGGFEAFQIDLVDFVAKWLPGLTKDQILVGVNWVGERASGYDMRPDEVKPNLEAAVRSRQ